MPDVSESPAGVPVHVQVHRTEHPDGSVMLWVKGKQVVLNGEQAIALAEELLSLAGTPEPVAASAPPLAVVPEEPSDRVISRVFGL